MYDPTSDSDGDGICAITCAKFIHDVLDMSFYCLLRDEKERCDVAVPISSGDLLKNLNLSLAQRFIPKMLHELNCDLGRDVFLADMHLADRIYELFSGHAFEHVALRSRLQRALNLGISFKRRKHDHTGVCELCANDEQCIDAPHIRHPDIHECHVGPMFTKALNAFVPSECLCNQLHVGFISDDGRNAFPHERMVVNAEDSNPRRSAHLRTRFPLSCLGVSSLSWLSQRNHCDIGPIEPFSNAIEPGTVRSTSVPAPIRLRSLRAAPILSERSRMPMSPQCPSRPECST